MTNAEPALDAAAQSALKQLADITVPPPVSWMPQTWGWAVVCLILLAAAVWVTVRWWRRRAANRYRVEALAELARLQAQLAHGAPYGQVLASIPSLLKRVALAAWPRTEVAALSGAAWVAFVRRHAGGALFPDVAARLLNDVEYRSAQAVASVSRDDATVVMNAARAWIERHDVSA